MRRSSRRRSRGPRSVFEPIATIVTAIISGQSLGTLTRAMIDEMNAARETDHANCTTTEAIALLMQRVAAAAVIRNLSDDQLATCAIVS